METKEIKILECCEALKERLMCNGWKGAQKFLDCTVIVGVDIFRYCPFCGQKISPNN